jgi:hypothetical protein
VDIFSALSASTFEVTSISTAPFRRFFGAFDVADSAVKQFSNCKDRVFDGLASLAIGSFDDNKRRKVAVIVVV